jgi:SlyX protein
MNVEIKLMHQEQTLETLNQVVMEQTTRIDQLEKRLALALERAGTGGEVTEPFNPDAERPPHY